MTDTEQIFERLDVNYVWPDSTRFPKKAWITGIHFVFIFIWKSRYDLRPCNSRLRSHLSQLGSLGDSRVHLMQSDRSPPTPRPLGANPRNARPHNITLPITKNGTRFNGLSLSLSPAVAYFAANIAVFTYYHYYPQPTCRLKASSTFQSQSFKFD